MNSPCPLRKAATGCLHSLTTASCRICREASNGFEGNWNLRDLRSYTGRSLSPVKEEYQELKSRQSSESSAMPSLLGQAQQPSMSGRLTHEYPTHNSSLGNENYPDLQQTTGQPFADPLVMENLMTSQMTYTFAVTTSCVQLARTTYNQLLWSGDAQFSGGRLRLASQEEHGQRALYRVIQKIPIQSSGMATRARSTWLSMNFEVESTSVTSSNGLTDIRLLWRLKDPQRCCEPNIFG